MILGLIPATVDIKTAQHDFYYPSIGEHPGSEELLFTIILMLLLSAIQAIQSTAVYGELDTPNQMSSFIY